MVESRRKKIQQEKKKKLRKPGKWYMLRIAFWSMLLAFGFVMLMLGYYLGAYL